MMPCKIDEERAVTAAEIHLQRPIADTDLVFLKPAKVMRRDELDF